jgi:geranylgeranyl pyrophosphate synthase
MPSPTPLRPIIEHVAAVRERLEATLHGSWEELERQVRGCLLDHPLPPSLVLPLASCAAAGGDPGRAAPIGAACAFLLLALRWFDDVQDRDRADGLWATVGPGRATNLAAAALTLAWKVLLNEPTVPRAVQRAFADACLTLARGQDRDIAGGRGTIDDYLEMIRQKTGAAYAFACRAGAMMADAPPTLGESCATYGEHLGTLLQILDDAEGVFLPNGKGDLALGKVTLPIIYALAVDHSAREELARIVEDGSLSSRAGRVLEILDEIDTRSFLLWAALQRRRQALVALSGLTAEDDLRRQGCETLELLIDAVLGDCEEFLARGVGGPDARKERDSVQAS